MSMPKPNAPDVAMSLKLYFYSNRNIIGTGTAIIAAALAAIGIIHDFWPIIVAGAYGAGALLTPSNSRMDISLAREMSDQEIMSGLTRIADRAQKMLPAAIAADVNTICNILVQAIPLVSKLQAGSPVTYDIRTTATEYLPQTLDRYLRMPKAFRQTVRTENGQTPAAMLAEQITLLKSSLTGMMIDLAASDADGLVANGRFLKEKFATPEFANIVR
jgi:hypothetical protein